MARREKSLLRFDAVRVEGAIIQPDVVDSAAKGAAEGQTPESYGIDRGLNLRDEIGRAYLVAKGLWSAYQEGISGPNPGAVRHHLAIRMLTRVLGFDLGQKRCYPAKNGADIDLHHGADALTPIAIGTGSDVDHVETLEIAGADPIRRSATTLVQGELNAREGALWGIATNGLTWRLLRDNESITRPGYIDIDLARIFRDDLYSDFTAFWLIAHCSRFPQNEAAGSDCSLERWRQIGREKGVTARTDLRDGVQKALFHFGRGFLENPANTALVARLNADKDEDRLKKEDLFRQLLRMVYRLIFVMTAEDRDILHPDGVPDAVKAAYEGGYATGRLRERARNRLAWDRHHDGFEGIKAVFRALHRGEPKLGLPALGGLFAPDQTPDLDGARLTNERFLKGFYGLAWLRRDKALSRINWRDMETEEFGSVYESLLELTPEITERGRNFSFVGQPDEDKVDGQAVGKNAKGNERKTTGSYYTPDSLVQLLLKEALDPVIDRKVAENPDDPEALLTLKVIDPACGSGHFILAAARKIARRLADLRHGGSPTVAQYRHALRDVARRCIYGVDRNPMAIELCRVAIWVETVEPGKPLTFMDQKVRCGDSLVGVYDLACLAKGIPNEAYAPLAGDDKAAAALYRKLNAKQREPKYKNQPAFSFIEPPAELANEAKVIESLPEDDLDQVATKRRKFEAWQGTGWINQKRACDLWTAAFFIPKKNVPPSPGLYEVPLTDNVWTAWSGTFPSERLQTVVDKVAKDRAFLHWPLVFADVIKGGGFDCVIGNPPWEVMQLSDEEFFVVRDPNIAALKGARRKTAICLLEKVNPPLFEDYQTTKRASSATNGFIRSCERFPFSAVGKLNTFALFTDLFRSFLVEGGRSGIIIPAEFATSENLANFFSSLVRTNVIESIFSFENEEFVFPGIANVVQFSLVTMKTSSIVTKDFSVWSYLRQIDQALDKERKIILSKRKIDVFTPTLGTMPIFRSNEDFQLANKLFQAPDTSRINSSPMSGGWIAVARQGLFNMAADSGLFLEAGDFDQNDVKTNYQRILVKDHKLHVPLYEGKFISHFDHRSSSYHNVGIEKGRGGRGLPFVKSEEYENPQFEVLPRYWIEKSTVEEELATIGWDRDWLLGWRDIANSKVERTVTMAFIPRDGVGDTCSVLFINGSAELAACLCANMNAMVLDFCARQIIGGTHVTLGYLTQLPLISVEFYSRTRANFVSTRVLELTYTSHSLAPFARDLGCNNPPFAWSEPRRARLRADLDAFYARAYGLTRDQLCYVLDPHLMKGPDYPSETFRVLQEKECRQYGEFRTGRLVLEAWDRMVSNGEFKGMAL